MRRAAAVILVGALMVAGGLGLATMRGNGVAAARIDDDVPATATDLSSVPAYNSPALAVDPVDGRFMVVASRLDNPFSCALDVSGDGGRGWVPAQPVPQLPAGAERCYAPEVAFDAAGTLYYLFVGLQGLGNNPVGAFLTRSTDQGRSFSPPHRVLGPERYMVRMAIDRTLGDRGRLHLVWLQAGATPPTGGLPPTANPIMAAHSDDGGATFSPPVRVGDPTRLRSVAPALTVGAGHVVHVLYYDLGTDVRDYQGLDGPRWEGDWSLVSTSSFDAGDHFDAGTVVAGGIKPPERVMLIYTMPPPTVVAGGSELVLSAWTDARHGDWDVLLSRSTDGGRSWSAPQRLNDDPAGNGRNHYMPHLSIADNGRVDAVFYDRRNDVENVRNDVYYTFSTDQGRTFAPNLRLTSESSDSRKGTRYPLPAARGMHEFGSRIGSVSEDEDMVAAWADTRNNRTGVQQDIFTAHVALPPADGGARVRWPLGVLLVGLGLALTIAAGALAGRRREQAR